MNIPSRTHWALWLIIAAAPLAGVLALRSLAGVGGPSNALGATQAASASAPAAQPSGTEQDTAAARLWVVPSTDVARLDSLSAEHMSAWTAPLFPVEERPTPTIVKAPRITTPSAPVTRSASRFDDQFRVTSLMTTRDGPVAVIDRKLRREGDDLVDGVSVESIDPAGRVVVLRTADGVTFERRPSR